MVCCVLYKQYKQEKRNLSAQLKKDILRLVEVQSLATANQLL